MVFRLCLKYPNQPSSVRLTSVMMADSACAQNLGDIDTVPLGSSPTLTPVATQAENPAWQPVTAGG